MPSPTVAFAELTRELKRRNPRLVDLAGGDVSVSGPPETLRDGALAHLAQPEYRESYPRVGGNVATGGLVETYRQFLWRQTGMGFTNAQVLVTPGAKVGIHLALQAIAAERPGSRVIIFKPAWPTFEERVRKAGLIPVVIGCNEDGSTDFGALAHALDDQVSCAIINNPRNPDGYVYPKDELKTISALARGASPGCIFLADEVYQLNLYKGATFVPLCTVLPQETRCISLFSLSKAFAAAGVRVGFASGDEQLITAMNEEQASTTGGVANILQGGAVGAFSEEALRFPGRLMETIQQYSQRVAAWATDTVFRVRAPQSTIYCCFDVSPLFGHSVAERRLSCAHDVALAGVEDFHVAAMFGDPFGDPNLLRMNLAQVADEAVLDEALSRFAALARAVN